MPDESAEVTPAPQPPAAEAAPPVAEPQTPAPEVLALAEELVRNGLSDRSHLEAVLTKGRSLDQLSAILKNDPKQFLSLLEQQDPEMAERMLDSATDRYLEKHPPSGKGAAKGGGEEEDGAITALRKEVAALRADQEQNRRSAAQAQLSARYENRIADLFGQLPDGLPKVYTEAIRAQLDRSLAGDQVATKRINDGNFVDIPEHFRRVVTAWGDGLKTAADADKSKRQKQAANARPTFLPGSEQQLPSNAPSPEEMSKLDWNEFEDKIASVLANVQ